MSKAKTNAAGARRPSTAAVAEPGQRLAEVVASRIEEEIVDRGWPVGRDPRLGGRARRAL